jgi:uncharacterized protein (TIGR00251 family)
VIPLTETPAGVSFRIRVVPRAGSTAVAGTRGDALLVRLAAAPVDGAANDALISMLAVLFQRPRRDITITAGERSRDKVIRIAGMSAAQVGERLSADGIS